MRPIFAAAALAAVLVPVLVPGARPAAAAALVESISPSRMAALLATEDGTAELRRTDDDTIIEGQVDGLPYTVFFYQCDGGEFDAPAGPDSACLSYEYRAYFSEYPADPQTVNAWNNTYHFGRLWRDEDGDLALHLTGMVEGGVSETHLRQTFAWWRAVIASFREFMEEHE